MNSTTTAIRRLDKAARKILGRYDFGGFMSPEWTPTEEILEYVEDEDKEAFEDAPLSIRLSAPGYLDCSEWMPIRNKDDIREFADIYSLDG